MNNTTPYWGDINWGVISGLFGAIGVFCSPFLMAWWNRRLGTPQAKAQGLETAAERIQRQANELYAQMERRAKEAEAEIGRLDGEAEKLRAALRGMEEWAHWLRHGWGNANAERGTFRRQLRRLIEEQADKARLLDALSRLQGLKKIPPVPGIAMVAGISPPNEEEQEDDPV